MVRVAEHYDVRKNALDPEASALSGGNLQKFVVGRELVREPRILVVHQPPGESMQERRRSFASP